MSDQLVLQIILYALLFLGLAFAAYYAYVYITGATSGKGFNPFDALIGAGNNLLRNLGLGNMFGVPGNQKEGETCQRDKLACGDGLACVDGVCIQKPSGSGDRCAPGTNAECPKGFTCWPRDGTGVCHSNRNAQKGELCRANAKNEIRCKENLTCWPRNGEAGKCYEDPAGPGDFCVTTGNDKIKCKDDHTCWPRGSSGGKCYYNRDAKEGELCVLKSQADGNSVECGGDLVCVGNKCMKNPEKAGDACEVGTKATCDDGQVCWPRTGSGICYNDRNQVEGGLCVTKSGDSRFRIECGSGLSCWPTGVGKCIPNRADKGQRCIKGDIVVCKDPYKCKNTDSDGVGICE
jgi:hypothetical protein